MFLKLLVFIDPTGPIHQKPCSTPRHGPASSPVAPETTVQALLNLQLVRPAPRGASKWSYLGKKSTVKAVYIASVRSEIEWQCGSLVQVSSCTETQHDVCLCGSGWPNTRDRVPSMSWPADEAPQALHYTRPTPPDVAPCCYAGACLIHPMPSSHYQLVSTRRDRSRHSCLCHLSC